MLGLTAAPATAQIMIDLPTIKHVSINSTVVSPRDAIAMLGVDASGGYHLSVMVVEKATGQRVGAEDRVDLPSGIMPVDVLYSSLVAPGQVLVLTEDRVVLGHQVSFASDGRPVISTKYSMSDPFGDDSIGAATAFEEAPNAADSSRPFLAIGTIGGQVVVANAAGVALIAEPRPDPILDLAAVAQVGHFAFVALTANKTTGSTLTGVNPRLSLAEPRPDPVVIFSLAEPRPDPLAEPRPDPLLSIAGVPFELGDEPLAEPAPVSLVGMNGTTTVSIATIGESPVTGGTFSLTDFPPLFAPVVEGAVGSLALVPADGLGVLFDPGFLLGQGGISGTLFTIYGNSVQLSPSSLKITSTGQFVTAVIEVAGGLAGSIAPASVVLDVGGGEVGTSAQFAPQVGDDDGDGIADLKVKFDRSAVQGAVSGTSGPTPVNVRWQFSFVGAGSASALITVIP